MNSPTSPVRWRFHQHAAVSRCVGGSRFEPSSLSLPVLERLSVAASVDVGAVADPALNAQLLVILERIFEAFVELLHVALPQRRL